MLGRIFHVHLATHGSSLRRNREFKDGRNNSPCPPSWPPLTLPSQTALNHYRMLRDTTSCWNYSTSSTHDHSWEISGFEEGICCWTLSSEMLNTDIDQNPIDNFVPFVNYPAVNSPSRSGHPPQREPGRASAILGWCRRVHCLSEMLKTSVEQKLT